jgi:CRP/FNR family cyclic AMP-dependent transcriptional regulator
LRLFTREGHLTPTVDSILRDHSFVQGLPEEQIARLASVATPVSFVENEIVLGDREQSSAFYFLISGSVAIELRATRYAVCVQAIGKGQVFGWSALLDRQDTLFQVRAREHTTALRIPGVTLKRVCGEDPQLGMELFRRTLQVVASRVRATEERFAEMCGIRV